MNHFYKKIFTIISIFPILLALSPIFIYISYPTNVSSDTQKQENISYTAETSSAVYSGLVQCDGVIDPKDPNASSRQKCDFTGLIKQVKFLINWGISIGTGIVVVLIIYAGYLYMTAHALGNPGQVGKAKKMFSSILLGYVFILCAWGIVYTLLTWISKDGLGMEFLIK